MDNLRDIRKAAHWSRERAAVAAGVSYATCRLFEVAPHAVYDPDKRRSLERVYNELRSIALGLMKSAA